MNSNITDHSGVPLRSKEEGLDVPPAKEPGGQKQAPLEPPQARNPRGNASQNSAIEMRALISGDFDSQPDDLKAGGNTFDQGRILSEERIQSDGGAKLASHPISSTAANAINESKNFGFEGKQEHTKTPSVVSSDTNQFKLGKEIGAKMDSIADAKKRKEMIEIEEEKEEEPRIDKQVLPLEIATDSQHRSEEKEVFRKRKMPESQPMTSHNQNVEDSPFRVLQRQAQGNSSKEQFKDSESQEERKETTQYSEREDEMLIKPKQKKPGFLARLQQRSPLKPTLLGNFKDNHEEEKHADLGEDQSSEQADQIEEGEMPIQISGDIFGRKEQPPEKDPIGFLMPGFLGQPAAAPGEEEFFGKKRGENGEKSRYEKGPKPNILKKPSLKDKTISSLPGMSKSMAKKKVNFSQDVNFLKKSESSSLKHPAESSNNLKLLNPGEHQSKESQSMYFGKNSEVQETFTSVKDSNQQQESPGFAGASPVTRKSITDGLNPAALDRIKSLKKALDEEDSMSSVKSQVTRSSLAKQRAEQRKKKDLALWKSMQEQTKFSEDCVDHFNSLKDILKQRVQFNKKKREVQHRIETRYKLHQANSEVPSFKQTIVRIPGEQDKKKQREDYIRGLEGERERQEADNLSYWGKLKAIFDESLLHVKDDYSFYVHGKYVHFSKSSLGMLDNKSYIRIAFVWLVTSKAFENLIISLILVNSLLLGVKDYQDKDNSTRINQFVESLEPYFMVIFLLECGSKVIAMGFVFGRKAYLTDAWNWLDFLVVVTSLLNELPSMENMSGLRTFRLFRPLRSLTTMPSMKLLIGTLLSSVSHLGGILGLAMFFFMIFAILGVHLWNGRGHYRCYETEFPLPSGEFNLVDNDTRLCSSSRDCPVGYCQSLYEVSQYLADNSTLWRDSDILELNYGITNFDNIFSAFLTIFQCITMEGWTKIMNIYEDAYAAGFVNIYFILCVVICSFFLLNLTIAVMLMKYEELDKNQANSKNKEELRQIGQDIKLPAPLIEFLIKQDSIQLSGRAKKMLKQEDSFIKQLFAPKIMIVDLRHPYYQNAFVKFFFDVAMNPYLDVFILLVIIINTVFQAMDRKDLDEETTEMLTNANIVFTGIFTFEVILKVIGFGFRQYLKDSFNQFDFIIVVISLLELQMQQTDQSVFSAMRAFRLFKIFKLFKVGDLRILMDSIAFTMTTISHYVILLCLFIYVFSLLGMSFFAGTMRFDENDKFNLEEGHAPRASFDQLHWAIITIFQVLLGESWNEIMYSVIRSNSGFSATYFIALVLTGNIIMLNLFLAILLGNFEKARNFGLKKKVFEAFREIIAGGKTLNQSLDIILGDMSIHVKIKILKWDEIMVRRIHEKGDTDIAQDLLEHGARFFEEKSDHEQPADNIENKQIELSHVENISEGEKSQEEGDIGENNDQSPIPKSAMSKASKKEMENKMAEIKKKILLYAKTMIKFHKFNSRLKRLPEMSMDFHRNPRPALRMILEKKVDLEEAEMNPFTEEEMLDNISHSRKDDYNQQPTFLLKKKKKTNAPSLSSAATEQNIQEYKNSQQFDKQKKTQEKQVGDSLHKFQQYLDEKRKVQEDNNSQVESADPDDRPPSPVKSNRGAGRGESPSKIANSRLLNDGQDYDLRKIKESRQREIKLKTTPKKNRVVEIHNSYEIRKSPLKAFELAQPDSATKIRIPFTTKGESPDLFKKSNNLPQSLKLQFKGLTTEEFNSNQKVEEAPSTRRKPRSFIEKFIDRVNNSSLYIFHIEGWVRRNCLLLAESEDVLLDFQQLQNERKAQMTPEKRVEGIEEDQESVLQPGPDTLSRRSANSPSNLAHTEGSVTNRAAKLKQRSGVFNLEESQEANNTKDEQLQLVFTKKRAPQQHPSKVFDNIVLVLILTSSITLVLDNPLNNPNGKLMRVLSTIDLGFTFLFMIEAMIKIIAKGLIFNNLGPVQPYLRSYWNLIDAFVVVASLLDFALSVIGLELSSLQALKALRALRALRPLRVISRNEGMRLVVNALFASLPSMGNVLLVCSLFILIFSIMGVNFFKGMFARCETPYYISTPLNMTNVNTTQDCYDIGGVWVNKPANFDNTGNAMNTLFQMTSTEGWVDVMYSGIDARGNGLQPKENTNIYLVLYFISFMIIGSQFIINLFVGVVIDNFNTIKEREELGNMFVTESQKSWIEIQKIGLGKHLKTKIKQPTGGRLPFFRLVKSTYFEYTITFFIILNTAVMAVKHYGMPSELEEFSEKANLVFAFVFNCEMILKIIGLGFETYFMNSWNKFDMFIVMGTDFGLLLNIFEIGGGFSTAASVIRGFRIMRMFRLIKSSVHVRLILDTIMNILPQITNVMSLIVLLFFIYAVLALNLFSGVRLQHYLDEKNNFQEFSTSMIILMKFSTGEDWNQFMYELANKKPFKGVECINSQSYDDVQRDGIQGCGSIMSYPFFISFTILVSMLIMNLSVAAVIEGLDTAKKENMGIVQGDDIEGLIDLWEDYDPLATGWITMTDLIFLLYELPPPLGKPSYKFAPDDKDYEGEKKNQGLGQQDRYLVNYRKRIVLKKVDALELLKNLKIKVHMDSQKQVHYVDVFKALMKRIFLEQKIDFKLSQNLNRKMKNQWTKKHKDVVKEVKGKMTVREEQAGLIITKWARKCLNMQRSQQPFKKPDKKKSSLQTKYDQKKDRREKEDKEKLAGQKRKQRQQVLQEQAAIILNIIKGVNDSIDEDEDQDQPKFLVQNEYSWKQKGGERVLEELNREEFDSDFKSDFSNEEEQEEFEQRYQLYRQMRQKQKYEPNRYNNDLFTLKQEDSVSPQKVTLSAKGNYEGIGDATHVNFKRFDQNGMPFVAFDSERGSAGTGDLSAKSMKDEKARKSRTIIDPKKKAMFSNFRMQEPPSESDFTEDKDSRAFKSLASKKVVTRENVDEEEKQNTTQNSISINVGHLEKDDDDTESKSIFIYDKDSLSNGKRPKRDLLAERYEREKQYQKKILQNSINDSTSPKKQSSLESKSPLSTIKRGRSLEPSKAARKQSPYFEQREKMRRLQKSSKQDLRKKKEQEVDISKKTRPQMDRKPADFIEGISGRTIEIDEREEDYQDQGNFINKFSAQNERALGIRKAPKEDLVSKPALDKLIQPSRAVKNLDQEIEIQLRRNRFDERKQSESLRNEPGPQIKPSLRGNSSLAQAKKGGLSSFNTASLQVQKGRNGAVSTLKSRFDENKRGLGGPSPARNNFFGE